MNIHDIIKDIHTHFSNGDGGIAINEEVFYPYLTSQLRLAFEEVKPERIDHGDDWSKGRNQCIATIDENITNFFK